MATKTREPEPSGDEYEQMFADWVYQVPGLLLMAGGFGLLMFLTFF